MSRSRKEDTDKDPRGPRPALGEALVLCLLHHLRELDAGPGDDNFSSHVWCEELRVAEAEIAASTC